MMIVLTKAEKAICEWVGRQRLSYAQRTNRNAGEGPSRGNESPKNHIRGAECELAASIALNVSWRPNIGLLNEHDIGGFIEVRSTDLPDGRLIVKPDAADIDPYVLMIVTPTGYRCAGWALAEEVKKLPLRHYSNTDPAHYMDQGNLRSVETIDRKRG